MNNKMSYNDVESLKKTIRSRLEAAAGEINRAGMSGVDPVDSFDGLDAAVADAISGIGKMFRNSANGRQPNRPQGAGHNVKTSGRGTHPNRETDNAGGKTGVKMQQENCKHGVPVEKPQKPQFDKYPCGHPYPHMTVRQQLQADLDKENDQAERVDRLRYAFVMSEILSEPICKRRRHRTMR